MQAVRLTLGTGYERFCNALNKVINGKLFPIFLLALASVLFGLGYTFELILALLAVASLILIVSADVLPTVLPVLLISVSASRMYDSAKLFLSVWWVALIPVCCIIFHFIYYKPVKRERRLTAGFAAISLATLAGGVFSISAADYFAPSALYYTLGLGVGMLAAYFVLSGYLNPNQNYDITDKLSRTMLYAGLFCVIALILQYFTRVLPMLKENAVGAPTQQYVDMIIGGPLQLGNNLSTYLLITMPFAFLIASKSKSLPLALVAFILSLVQGAAMLFTMSRAGFILSFVFITLSLTVTIIANKSRPQRLIFFALALFALAAAVIAVYFSNASYFDLLLKLCFFAYGSSTKAFIGLAIVDIVLLALASLVLAIIQMPTKKRKIAYLTTSTAALIGLTVMFAVWDKIYPLFASLDASRAAMANVAVSNFYKYPVFGTGLGYRGMQNIYNPKTGMLNCYHCALFQIIGSMGVVGIVAYGLALKQELDLFATSDSKYKNFFAVSIIGLYAMSMFNPGIFIPLPYALLAVLILTALESETKKPPSANANGGLGR